MHQLREDHYEELNAAKDNGKTETIEEFNKLRQTLEDKKVNVMKFGEEWDMLMVQLQALQQSFNEARGKKEKDAKNIWII